MFVRPRKLQASAVLVLFDEVEETEEVEGMLAWESVKFLAEDQLLAKIAGHVGRHGHVLRDKALLL